MSAQGLSSRAIIGEFYARLEQNDGAAWMGRISNLFQSNQESETYKWLGMAPAMREWVGGRQAKGFRENGITIANKRYEATLEVLLDEMRRDKTGQVMVRVAELAQRNQVVYFTHHRHLVALATRVLPAGSASVRELARGPLAA